MAELDRRSWLKLTGLATAATAVVTAGRPGSVLAGAAKPVARLDGLKAGEAVAFQWPDAESPCWLLKTGRATDGGVGPDRDVVAYSALCTHQGCPVVVEDGRFICPCHFSQFDPEKGGQCYQGVATVPLPRVQLAVRDGHVVAVGMDGLPWGRVEGAR